MANTPIMWNTPEPRRPTLLVALAHWLWFVIIAFPVIAVNGLNGSNLILLMFWAVIVFCTIGVTDKAVRRSQARRGR